MPESERKRENSELTRVLAFNMLPEPTKGFFTPLRKEEVDTLQRLSLMDKEEQEQLFQAIKLAQSFITAGKTAKWPIISVVGTFVGFMLLADNIQKALVWFQNGRPK